MNKIPGGKRHSWQRRTKIVATLGPATDSPGVLEQLLEAGIDCARLNCSHSDTSELRRRTEALRAAQRASGRAVGVLFDLQGPKLRLSAQTASQELALGEEVLISDLEVEGHLTVNFKSFSRLVTEESEIVIGDGAPRLAVKECGEVIRAEVKVPGAVGANKGISVSKADTSLPAMTAKDEEDLDCAIECGANFVALSFVRDGADVELLKNKLADRGRGDVRVIAKIEKLEAYQKLDQIIAAADGIMVARGDFGVEVGLGWVPVMQKDIIERANRAGKIVITATQMIETMITSPQPTRAEASDVANAVFDGTSAAMLSAESAVGSYPVEAVRAMSDILDAAEHDAGSYCMNLDEDDLDLNPAQAVMHAAVTLGRDVDAAAIVVPTTSGGAVRAAIKYRPRRPVIAISHDQEVAEQLALEWGVFPAKMPVISDVEEMIASALAKAKETLPELEAGALVVVSAGPTSGLAGETNLLTLRRLP